MLKSGSIFCSFWFFLGSFFSVFAQKQAPPTNFPQFKFYDLSGNAFTNNQIKAGLPMVVFYFDPDCDHCQLEAKMISSELNSFGQVNLLWVSTAEEAAIKSFQQKFFAGAKTPVYFVRDKDYKFDGYFGYSVAPTILVFGKNGIFLKKFTNEIAPVEIRNLLK
ncbi:MAG: redoxin domain-containing protein [Bacteroidia bacterium]|nr:redoxin domain-containing protein [Bacteroidia bacterium]